MPSPTTSLLPHRQPSKEALPREADGATELEHRERGIGLRKPVDRLRAQLENAGDLVRGEVLGRAHLVTILRRHVSPLRKPHASRARSSAELKPLSSRVDHHDVQPSFPGPAIPCGLLAVSLWINPARVSGQVHAPSPQGSTYRVLLPRPTRRRSPRRARAIRSARACSPEIPNSRTRSRRVTLPRSPAMRIAA